jgi:ribonuclease P protein component
MLNSTRRLRSSDVERVLKAGFSLMGGSVRVKAIARSKGSLESRFAVVVSKKVAGTAVVRNRMRRLAFSLLEEQPSLKNPHDVALLLGKKYEDRSALAADIETALARLR